MAGWWGTLTASHRAFRCEGCCQHPGDFHTCSGAGRKNELSLATPYGFVFPISRLLGNGLHPPPPAGCWESKSNFQQLQILGQVQNPAQANPCWCCSPSKLGRSPPRTAVPPAHCTAQPGLTVWGFFSCSHLWALAVISKHLLQIIQDYRN